MTYHGRSKRKRTGGRLRPHRKKRFHERGRPPAETELGARTVRSVDARGGTTKDRALSLERASVRTPDGETVATEIEDVVENPSNPNYARRNIITKGAVIETGVGRARVTSRPGQDGQVNAIAIED